MADQAYVVMATQGYHDNLSVRAVVVYADEGLAQKHAEAAEEWAGRHDARVWPGVVCKGEDGWAQSPYDPGLECLGSSFPTEYQVETVDLRTALPVVEGGEDA